MAVNYNFGRYDAKQPIKNDGVALALSEIGSSLITQAMQAERDETLNRYRSEREQIQYGREDARNTVMDERHQREYDADQEYRGLLLKGQQADRAATSQYRADQLKQNEKEFRVEQAGKARDRAMGLLGGERKLDPKVQIQLDSADSDIELYNKMIEEGSAIPKEVKANYDSAKQWKTNNGFSVANENSATGSRPSADEAYKIALTNKKATSEDIQKFMSKNYPDWKMPEQARSYKYGKEAYQAAEERVRENLKNKQPVNQIDLDLLREYGSGSAQELLKKYENYKKAEEKFKAYQRNRDQ